MGRISFKNIFFILLGFLGLIFLILENRCKDDLHTSLFEANSDKSKDESRFDNITCVVNKEVSKNVGAKFSPKYMGCKTDGREVYVPFSFLKNYYEARGEMNKEGFEISHSYSKVFSPKSKYDPRGQFMHFKSFNVEARSRVKCVSAASGVPVSTQWSAAGYYYSTQIAQFFLSHYSNHIAYNNKEAQKTKLDDEAVKNKAASRVIDDDSKNLVVEFKDTLDIHVHSKFPILCMEFKSIDRASFKIHVETDLPDEIFILNYFPVDNFLSVDNNEIVFGFGSHHQSSSKWLKITRDIYNDIEKVLNLKKSPHKYKKTSLQVTLIQFSGHGQVSNISLSAEEHLRMFFHGADWFLENQDESGGWPSFVIFNKEKKKYPKADEIRPGWYGAMCQGQAISVLVRAFAASGKHEYLDAANKATKVFHEMSIDGGVRAIFMNKFVWYEEYPTNPPTFILNGFMYALLGLYDLKSVSPDSDANTLYER